ncbi:MAG: glycosyltransferase family 39 protein [Planctomycetes bacterium]|nr:glycosyltransferase family 39 protein [Planctomycetota bacterium]
MTEPLGRRPLARSVALAAAVLLLAHALLILRDARAMGPVTDEFNYFHGGHVLVERGCVHPATLYQGPLAQMANQLFVTHFGGAYPRGGLDTVAPDRAALFRGRLATLPFALLSAVLVFLWARKLFGDAGGLLALLVHALNPLMLGYGSLMLVDAQLTALTLLCLYLVWRYFETRAPRFVPWIGVALGLALGTKYLAVLLAVPLGVSVASAAFTARAERRALRALGVFLTVVLCALLTLHATYLFREGFGATDPSAYESALMQRIVRLPALGPLAALLPSAFLRGVDFQLTQGQVNWRPFLNGEFAHGHPSYYLWSILCKTPEIVLLGGALAAFVFVRGALRADAPRGWRTAAAASAPYALLAFVYVSASSMQLGIRYVLPLLPLGFVLVGALAWRREERVFGPRALAVGALLAALLGQDLVRDFPDWISYYNRASGGQALAFRRFRDTNSDFGQYQFTGIARLRELHGEFQVLGGGSGARFGRLAIDADALRSPEAPGAWLTWLDPVAHLGASWWLFELTPEAFEARVAADHPELRRDLAVAYLGVGRVADAERHLAELEREAAAPLKRLISVENAVRTKPDKVQLEALLAAWLALARPDRAEAVALEHADALAGSMPTLMARVQALEERSDFVGAVELLQHSAIDPAHAAQLWLIRDLRRLGRERESADVFERVKAGLGDRPKGPAYEEFASDMEQHVRYLDLLR